MSVTKVKKDLIEELELSEIDFDLHNEFKNDPNDDDEEIDYIENGHSQTTDSTPISIERLEKLLLDFKSKGATHVEIEYHGDHFGYLFSTFKIHK